MMRTIWLLVITLLLLAGCTGETASGGGTAPAGRDADGHSFLGNPAASVVVEEWSDLQ